MKKIRQRRAGYDLLLASFLSLLVGCSTLQTTAPEVQLVSLQVTETTLSHLNMIADLRVFNPNDFSITINRVKYELMLNDIKVLGGDNTTLTDVEAHQTTTIPLRLAGAYWDLFSFFNSTQNGEKIIYRLKGDVELNGGAILFRQRFPFEKTGALPLLEGVNRKPVR